MVSKQRVFSTQSNINYIDYNKNKNGIEFLKNIKSKEIVSPQIINKFNNYNDFITQSKTFYKYLHQDKCEDYFLTDLYNANTSYIQKNDNTIYYDNMNNNLNNNNKIISNCCSCKQKYPKITETLLYDQCNIKSQILYPYGIYKTNEISTMYFPYKLDLNKWCLHNKQTCNYTVPFDSINTPLIENTIVKSCKTGLCKNTRPLFV
jgi:hypothetical protein